MASFSIFFYFSSQNHPYNIIFHVFIHSPQYHSAISHHHPQLTNATKQKPVNKGVTVPSHLPTNLMCSTWSKLVLVFPHWLVAISLKIDKAVVYQWRKQEKHIGSLASQ
jgi:hypothetical protein